MSLRSAQTLETVAVLKQPGDEVTGISFSSRGDIIAMHKSFGENSGQDDTVVICCDSGRVAVRFLIRSIHYLLLSTVKSVYRPGELPIYLMNVKRTSLIIGLLRVRPLPHCF